MPSKLTNEQFIEKCHLRHGDKWNYSLTNYTGTKNKVVIICKEHGEFIQTASDHLSGCGCPSCDSTKRMTTEIFIEKSKKIHGEKWNYSKVSYGNHNYETVEIICEMHGSFLQRPWAHLRGQGCPKCQKNTLMSNDEFIERCRKIHNDKWDYSLTNYIGRRKEIQIICKKHGIFTQMARVHLDGFGCKICRNSKLEEYLLSKLTDINEPFERGKKFDSCRNKLPLPFDFYLPLRNLLIECDGIQHRESVEHFGGEERLEYQKQNDFIKTRWAAEFGIELVRLIDFKEIDELVKKINESEILFSKSVLKDLNTDRVLPTISNENYLVKTDFNWYKKDIFNSEIEKFIQSLGVNYMKNYEIGEVTIDFCINDVYILLIDHFRDCEINKKRNWLRDLKSKLEEDNINLICIYPDDWFKKCDIVKSRITNNLGMNQFKIGARKCKIVIPSNNDVNSFLEENHIQGKINSSIKIALVYNEKIVSIMTFGKLRRNLGQKSKLNSFELLRFCNKRGWSVSGSANKLFKYFIKNFRPNYVLSYADRCWTKKWSNVYIELGMKLIGDTDASYSYLVGDKKWDRFKYRKDRLIQYGYIEEKWTERSICSSNNIFKIWDCGCLKYELVFRP